MKPKLSILIPTIFDYDGAYFTVQNLRLNNDLSECEIILGDARPDSPGSGELRALFGGIKQADGSVTRGVLDHFCAGTRYISTATADGTAAAKEMLIQEARGESVLCMDSHVLLKAGAINKLLDYYGRNPSTRDLITGPLTYDSLTNFATHFDNFWRGEMWGTWGTAWRAPCENGDLVSVREEGGRLRFWSLEWDAVPLTRSMVCDRDYPDIPFAGYEEVLKGLGFVQMGKDESDDFEIPAQGMGLFSCRKEAWPGFNHLFRGFGGEEMYIHAKFRQRGGTVRCLGILPWIHRFAKPMGIRYRLTQWDKARNYVIGLQELGLPIDPVHEMFVEGENAKISQYKWERLIADPTQAREPIDPVQVAVEKPVGTIEDLYQAIKAKPRDLDKHMDRLSELAAKCAHVTEFSRRRESLIAFARSPETAVMSFNSEVNDDAVRKLLALNDNVRVISLESDKVAEGDVDTDLLFIDQLHTYARVADDLKRFSPKVRRFIVLHDTMLHASRGEDGGPGLGTAITDFIEENSDWFIASHDVKQHGLTVLGRFAEDRPEQTITPWPPAVGPGTELHDMLASIGIRPADTCSCRRMAADMNTWGVDGCRRNRDRILDMIHQNYEQWGWKETLGLVAAGGKAIITGLAFKIDPFHPVESMVDEAIRRAEAKELKKKGGA